MLLVVGPSNFFAFGAFWRALPWSVFFDRFPHKSLLVLPLPVACCSGWAPATIAGCGTIMNPGGAIGTCNGCNAAMGLDRAWPAVLAGWRNLWASATDPVSNLFGRCCGCWCGTGLGSATGSCKPCWRISCSCLLDRLLCLLIKIKTIKET